jgi:hypothetical protein
MDIPPGIKFLPGAGENSPADICLVNLPGQSKKIVDRTYAKKTAGAHPEYAAWNLSQIKTVKTKNSEA